MDSKTCLDGGRRERRIGRRESRGRQASPALKSACAESSSREVRPQAGEMSCHLSLQCSSETFRYSAYKAHSGRALSGLRHPNVKNFTK